jgi:uncharacterized damage-inducible protein DinB
MKKLEWFERTFSFGVPAGMLPFYLERLQGTTARLLKKVEGVSEELLSNKLDGKWSIKQNIGHLSEVDEIANKRMDEMVNGISPLSPAVFEPKLDYNSRPVKEVLALFEKNRKENLKKYGQLSDDALAKSSLHPRLKVQMTPVDLAYFDAEHDDHHLVRINEILTALKTT